MEEHEIIRHVSRPLYESRGWMKLYGVVMIIQGVLTVWFLIGILPLWLGVLLFKSASAVETAHIGGSQVDLIVSLQRLKTYFIINGVLTLLMIAGVVFVFLIAGAGILASLGEFSI